MATVTFKNNLEMIQLIPLIHNKTFIEGSFGAVDGVEVCSSLQPIPKDILQASEFAGGNRYVHFMSWGLESGERGKY